MCQCVPSSTGLWPLSGTLAWCSGIFEGGREKSRHFLLILLQFQAWNFFAPLLGPKLNGKMYIPHHPNTVPSILPLILGLQGSFLMLWTFSPGCYSHSHYGDLEFLRSLRDYAVGLRRGGEEGLSEAGLRIPPGAGTGGVREQASGGSSCVC